MTRSRTVTAATPEAMARALGLNEVNSQEWQVQHAGFDSCRYRPTCGVLPQQSHRYSER
jgi:hypothetical protein